ncbi:MAG: gamma-glutamylcyclotransferase family protein [Chloroflexota bacterium]
MNELVFAYGTLLDAAIQRSIIGRVVNSSPDTLPDYRIEKVLFGQQAFPIIRPYPGATVKGRVLLVYPLELRRIDHYETDAYERRRVQLASGRRAWAYCAPTTD